MARKYEKVKMLLPVVQQMQAERKTRKEIARDLGLKSKRAVKDLLYWCGIKKVDSLFSRIS